MKQSNKGILKIGALITLIAALLCALVAGVVCMLGAPQGDISEGGDKGYISAPELSADKTATSAEYFVPIPKFPNGTNYSYVRANDSSVELEVNTDAVTVTARDGEQGRVDVNYQFVTLWRLSTASESENSGVIFDCKLNDGYQWEDGSTQTKTVYIWLGDITSIGILSGKERMPLPMWNGKSEIYANVSQNIYLGERYSWYGFSDYITVSPSLSSSAATPYGLRISTGTSRTYTFTLKDNAIWYDKTTDPKTFTVHNGTNAVDFPEITAVTSTSYFRTDGTNVYFTSGVTSSTAATITFSSSNLLTRTGTAGIQGNGCTATRTQTGGSRYKLRVTGLSQNLNKSYSVTLTLQGDYVFPDGTDTYTFKFLPEPEEFTLNKPTIPLGFGSPISSGQSSATFEWAYFTGAKNFSVDWLTEFKLISAGEPTSLNSVYFDGKEGNQISLTSTTLTIEFVGSTYVYFEFGNAVTRWSDGYVGLYSISITMQPKIIPAPQWEAVTGAAFEAYNNFSNARMFVPYSSADRTFKLVFPSSVTDADISKLKFSAFDGLEMSGQGRDAQGRYVISLIFRARRFDGVFRCYSNSELLAFRNLKGNDVHSCGYNIRVTQRPMGTPAWSDNSTGTKTVTYNPTAATTLTANSIANNSQVTVTRPTGIGGTGTSVTVNAGTAAGTYTVTFALKNPSTSVTDSKYVWEDGTTGNKTLKITVSKANQSAVAIGGNASVAYNGSITLTASGGNDGTYKWAVTNGTGAATLSATTGGSVTLKGTKVGKVTVKLYRAATTNYNDSATVSKEITITKANQSNPAISGNATVVYGSTLALTASGANEGAYTWAITNGTGGATLSATTGGSVTLTPTKVGKVTVSLYRAGGSSYNTSSTVTKEITVQAKGIAVPTLAKGSGADTAATVSAQTATTTYNGGAQHFTISSTSNITFGTPTSGATRTNADFYATNANANGYTVTMTIDATKYCWGGNNSGDTASKTLKIIINKFTPTVTASVADGRYVAGNQLSTVGLVLGSATGVNGSALSGGLLSWTTGTTALASPSGNYGWTYVPADTTNYNNATGTLTVYTLLEPISIAVNGAKTTYKAYESFTETGMTVTATYRAGKAPAAVTGYTVTVDYSEQNPASFIVADSGKQLVTVSYTENGFTVTAKLTITVVKADYDMSGLTMSADTVTYNGLPHTITASGTTPSGVTLTGYTYSKDGTVIDGAVSATNAGTYVVAAVFTIADPDNYNMPSKSATLTIQKATPTATVAVTTGDGIYYYVGEDLPALGGSLCKVTSSVPGSFAWDDDPAKFTGLGVSYGWTFTPTDSANYNAVKDGLLINACYKLTGLTVTGATTAYTAHDEFDTSVITVTASYLAGKGDTVLTGGYTLTYPSVEGHFVLADNNKEITFTYSENGQTAEYRITVTVVAKEYDMTGVTMTDKTVEYDGSTYSVEIAGTLPAGVTLKGYTYSKDGADAASATGASNAGKYVVAAVFDIADPDNYLMPELSANLIITKATPTADVSVVAGNYYAGETLSTVYLHIESSSVTGTVDWDDDTLILSTGTSYQWVFTPADSANYNEVFGQAVIDLKVKVDKLVVHGATTTYKAYDRFITDGVTVEVIYLAEKEPVTYNLSELTFTYPDLTRDYFLVADNGKDVTVYCEGVSVKVTVSVAKKSVVIPAGIMSDKTETYKGEELSIEADLSVLPEEIAIDRYEYNGDAATGATDVGTYTVVVYFKVASDTDNIETPDPVSATLIINQANPNVTVKVVYGRYGIGTLLKDVVLEIDQSDADGTLSWLNDNMPLTEGGAYQWEFVPDDTKNYISVRDTVSVEIYYVVSSIVISNPKTDYEAYDEFDQTQITVRAIYEDPNKAPAYVTGWTVTYPDSAREYFLVADDGKDVTITYGDASATVTVNVVKKTVDMSGVQMDDRTETYNGSEWSVTAGSLPRFVAVDRYEYNGTAATGATDAGDYTVTAVFTVTDTDNVNVPESMTASLHIDKADPTLNTDGVATTYTYTGETITVASGATVDNGEQTVVYTDNSFLNVTDSGNLTVSVDESKNYNAASVQVYITIDRAQLTLTWTGGNAPYDGKTHSAKLEVTGEVGQDAGVITADNLASLITASYTGPDADRKLKGTYTVTLAAFPTDAPYDNYTYIVTNDGYSFEITDGVVNITFNSESVVYDGDTHNIEADGVPDEMTVKYYYKGTTTEFTGETDVMYDTDGVTVTGYEIVAEFECNTGNYTAPAAMTATLTITPREIADGEVSGVDATYTYDGTVQKPVPTVKLKLTADGAEITLASGDYDVTYDNEVDFNAGTVVTVTVEGRGNYGGSVNKTFTIKKAKLDVEWDEGDYTYNNTPQGVTATLTGLAARDETLVTFTQTYTGRGGTLYSDTTLPTLAGYYTVTVTLDSVYSNYEGFTDKTCNFEIKKADATVEWEFDRSDYDPDDATQSLYEGSAMPKIILSSTPKAGDIEVTGTLGWTQSSLLYGKNEYIWIFTPDDTDNFNTVSGKYTIVAVKADIVSLTVGWIESAPDVYVSTTLTEIRDYLVVTGVLANDKGNVTVADYALTGQWAGGGEVPKFAGKYTLTVRFNGLSDSIEVNYLALAYSLRIEAADAGGIKTDYYGLQKFDTSTVKITAVRNDGVEEILKDTDYVIVYNNGGELWVGDSYVTVTYDANGTLANPVTERIDKLKVEQQRYDLSGLVFPATKSVKYDGSNQAYTIDGASDDLKISYLYEKKNSDGDWETVSESNVKDAGVYRITATFTLVGDKVIANYFTPDDIYSELTINKASYTEQITLNPVQADYDYGNSLKNSIKVENLPQGVVATYEYFNASGEKVTDVINAGVYKVTVSFTVDDNHNAIADLTANLTVNKITPETGKPGVGGNLSVGTKLNELTLSAELDGVAGTFTWVNGEQVLKEGINICLYTFTPDDAANFNVVKGSIELPAGSVANSTGVGGSGLSSGMFTAIICAIAVSVLVSVIALVSALKRKGGASDGDGFYDDVSEGD